MSFFAVTLETIDKTWPIEGADAIELAKVKSFGWQFVVQKGKYKPGDVVAYFPLDSVIPMEILERLDMVGKFSGKDKDRVKTRTFRGQMSQGFVASFDDVEHFIKIGLRERINKLIAENNIDDISNTDITEDLGVTKYEPPMIPDKSGKLYPLPDICHGRYDIEGCNNYLAVVNELMDKHVIISEKLEGSNFSVAYDPLVDGGKLFVSQRNYTIVPLEDENTIHDFWRIAKEKNIIKATMSLHKRFGGRVVIRGEFLGPGYNGNIYQLKNHEVRVFDIMLDDQYVSAQQFTELCSQLGLVTCPIIAKNVILRDWLAGRTIDEAATDFSMLLKILREGIVIKPMLECRNRWIGRTIIKHRSAKYLAKEKD